jgi:2-pyrone-4,6-dicarboxylate lactonase
MSCAEPPPLSPITRPRKLLPAGACDCHAHLFGPYERFPLAGERSYSPPAAPFENYQIILDIAGLERGVLVQPSAYGLDCSVMLDGLQRAPQQLRGVAVIDCSVADSALEAMQARGVRGVRFTEMMTADGRRFSGSVGVDQFDKLASRLRELQWHAQIWADCARLVEAAPRLLSAGIEVVADHMGVPDVARSAADPTFQKLLALIREGGLWIKLSVARNSECFPEYEDVRPFHDALMRANPDRLIWGSDWPFLRMHKYAPRIGHLIDVFDRWVTDAELRQKVFVTNPAKLYGFP